jgi:hypothetical protein
MERSHPLSWTLDQPQGVCKFVPTLCECPLRNPRVSTPLLPPGEHLCGLLTGLQQKVTDTASTNRHSELLALSLGRRCRRSASRRLTIKTHPHALQPGLSRAHSPCPGTRVCIRFLESPCRQPPCAGLTSPYAILHPSLLPLRTSQPMRFRKDIGRHVEDWIG